MSDDATRILRERGFELIAKSFAEEAAAALAAARSMTARRPVDIDPAVEPAHVYRAIGTPR